MRDADIRNIARVVHEAMRAWQQVNGQDVAPAWEDATWERESTIAAVRLALTDPTPGKQHDRWMQERLDQGWTYGPVKDPQERTNPALVPFDRLPSVEIAKDHLVISITQALAGVMGREGA